jgi:hypothetical protein
MLEHQEIFTEDQEVIPQEEQGRGMPGDKIKKVVRALEGQKSESGEGAEEEEEKEEERRSERQVQMRDWRARKAQEDAQIQQLG